MNQAGKQPAPRSIEEKMIRIEKLLKRLTAQLNIFGQGKTKLPKTFNTPIELATTTPSRNK